MSFLSLIKQQFLMMRHNRRQANFFAALGDAINAACEAEALKYKAPHKDVFVYRDVKFGDMHIVKLETVKFVDNAGNIQNLGKLNLIYCKKELEYLQLDHLKVPFALTFMDNDFVLRNQCAIVLINSTLRDLVISKNALQGNLAEGIVMHEVGHIYRDHAHRFGINDFQLLWDLQAEKEADLFALKHYGAVGIFTTLILLWSLTDTLAKDETMKKEMEDILKERIMAICEKVDHAYAFYVPRVLDYLHSSEFKSEYPTEESRLQLFLKEVVVKYDLFQQHLLERMLTLDQINLCNRHLQYLKMSMEEAIPSDQKARIKAQIKELTAAKNAELEKFGIERYNNLYNN